MNDEKRKDPQYKQFVRYSSIGLEMGLSVAIGVTIGYYLDRFFNTSPWLTLIFLILGSVAGFRRLFSLLKDLDKNGRKK